METLHHLSLKLLVDYFVDISLIIISKQQTRTEKRINELIEKMQEYYEPCRIFLHRTNQIQNAWVALKTHIFEERKILRSKETRLRLWFWQCFENLETKNLKLTCLCKPTYSPWSHKVNSEMWLVCIR